MGPELDPRQVFHGGNVEKTPHQTAWQVNIADADGVIECEAARHDPDDGVRGVIHFQRSPDDVAIAAEVALPEAVVENNHGAAAVLCVGWLDVATEKRAHTKESPGILREVDARYVFGQSTAGDLHVRFVEAKRRIDRGGKEHLIKLCLGEDKPVPLVRMLPVDENRVHDAVGAGVRKRVQQDGVDEREHCRSGADAEREGEHGDGGEARVAAQGAEAVADVATQLIEEAEADGIAVVFVLRGGPAEIDAGFAPGLFFGEALADQIFLVSVESKTKLFFDVAVGAWRDGLPELANSGDEAHISPAFLLRMPATTAAMSVHLAVSALS